MSLLVFPRAERAPGPGQVRAQHAVPGQAGSPPLSYLRHFGLAEAPFGLTPDTDFFYASPPHQEALNTLRYALENGEGFIKIVGAVGTGKTLLCRALLAALPAHCRALYLPNPALDPNGMLLAVADELGLDLAAEASHYRVHKAIQSRLIELAQQDIHVVLIVDEAQAMSRETLETVRLLSNLETEKRKLLSIVLFGQPELDAQLEAIPQLKTRIGFHDRLRALTRAELEAYLAHRLQRAGFGPEQALPFSPRAIGLLCEASRGVPRVVNVIAHKALMLAYGKGLQRVGRREMQSAAHDTLAVRSSGRATPWLFAVLGLLAAGLIAGGIALNR